MKVLVAILLFVACSQAANVRYGRNMDHYKPRWMKYPSYVKMVEEAQARNPKYEGKIVGGQQAEPNSWPHQVGLFVDNAWFCGGSIISDTIILTAGHCVDGASRIEVVMGAHEIKNSLEETQVSVFSTDFANHESYDGTQINNDIAYIRVPKISFNDNIKAVKLTNRPTSELVDNGDKVTLTGWGLEYDGSSSIAQYLNQVDVPIQASSKCINYYGGNWDKDYLVCVDTTGGMGSCSGDSGGPMNYKDMTWGITSFGSSAGCERGSPAGYTSVSYFWKWIEANTGVTHD